MPPQPNRELASVRLRMLGVCKAIRTLGLPLDRETRRWLRERMLEIANFSGSKARTSAAGWELLVEITLRFRNCDPQTSRQAAMLLRGLEVN